MNSKYVCHSQSGFNLFFLLSLRNRPNFFLCFCWFVGLLLCYHKWKNLDLPSFEILRGNLFFKLDRTWELVKFNLLLHMFLYPQFFNTPPPLSYILFIFLTAGLLHRAYPYVYFYCKNGFYVLYDRFIGLITSYNVYLWVR